MSETPRIRILVDGQGASCRVAILEDGQLVEFFPAESEGKASKVGNIYLGRVSKLAPGVEAAFVNIGLEIDAFLPQSDWPEDGLNPGQTLLVQIQKDPLGGKGARITSHLALAGRYLVYLPGGGKVRISKRIEDEAERERLEAVGESVVPEGDGLIMRTLSVGLEAADFAEDISALELVHRQLRAKSRALPVPSLVHREAGAVGKMVRDHLSDKVEAILVTDPELRDDIKNASFAAPAELLGRIRVDPNAFKEHGIERALERALKPKVYMKSGGHVVIQSTEALLSVDVNSGGAKGGADLEETALQTNLEASDIIARELRLRDLGGIIVIDFIDMLEPGHRDEVEERLAQALKKDRSNPRLHGWTELGLMLVSRRRRRKPLHQFLSISCEACHGKGWVDSPIRVVEKATRACRAYIRKNPGKKLMLRIHPTLIPSLRSHAADLLDRLEVKGDPSLPASRFATETY